jgi:GNAT superfamily N-acetyltransferase
MPTPVSGLGTSGTSSVGVLITAPFGRCNPRRSRKRPAVALELVAYKERLVREGKAHAAVVFDSDVAVAWCEYGSPEELPNIYHRKEYNAGLDKAPDYRLTCFFVDRNYRRKGVAAVALRGALDLIAKAGGGVVEAYPQDTLGKRTSGSFLYNGTRSLF